MTERNFDDGDRIKKAYRALFAYLPCGIHYQRCSAKSRSEKGPGRGLPGLRDETGTLSSCYNNEASVMTSDHQGYKYAMFNLVFSNDICSIGIWKELGFGEIGRIPMSAQLENREELVEAFVLGKELNN